MSSSVKVVRYLLANNPAFSAVVPSDRVAAGRLAPGTQLPAVTVAHISTVRRAVVKQGPTQFCTSRVQVTVHTKAYPEQAAVLKLAREALPPTRGEINGVDVDDIQSGGDGPDLGDDAAEIYMGTTDVIVAFNE